MQEIINNKERNENTYPKVIAEKLVQDQLIPREHLILITDGKITQEDITQCDAVIQNNKDLSKKDKEYLKILKFKISINL